MLGQAIHVAQDWTKEERKKARKQESKKARKQGSKEARKEETKEEKKKNQNELQEVKKSAEITRKRTIVLI